MSALQKWFAGIIASAMILAVGITGAIISSDAASTATTPTTTPEAPIAPEEADQVREFLTVTTISDDAQCVPLIKTAGRTTVPVEGGEIYAWEIGALEPVPPRLWSDAVSLPFAATEVEQVRREVLVTNCFDPLVAGQALHMFANATVGGFKLVDLNPWLAPWVGDPELVINARAAEFAPLMDETSPSDEQVAQAAAKQLEWQGVAARLNTLLLRIQAVGIEARQSIVNYHLVGGGLVVGNLPAVGFNYEKEGLPSLVLVVTRKDNCPLMVLGYNLGDRRLVLYEPCPKVPVQPGTTAPPTVTTLPLGSTTPPPVTTLPPGSTVPPPVTTLPPGSTVPPPVTTVPPTTVPPTVPPTTTKPCGDKNRPKPGGGCEPNLPPGGTVPAPPTTPPTATTVQPAPKPPSTAPSNTLPPGITPTTQNPNPPVVTFVPPGATQTTTPPATVAPPATSPPSPPAGGSTVSP